jgi:hypothetical protein
LEAKIQRLVADFGLFRTKAQQMLSSKDEEISKLKGRSANNSSPREVEAKPEAPLNPGKLLVGPVTQKLNTDYIKNVFIKYLEYQANGNEKEALTLEKVLFTVLSANDKDLESLEKAR